MATRSPRVCPPLRRTQTCQWRSQLSRHLAAAHTTAGSNGNQPDCAQCTTRSAAPISVLALVVTEVFNFGSVPFTFPLWSIPFALVGKIRQRCVGDRSVSAQAKHRIVPPWSDGCDDGVSYDDLDASIRIQTGSCVLCQPSGSNASIITGSSAVTFFWNPSTLRLYFLANLKTFSTRRSGKLSK